MVDVVLVLGPEVPPYSTAVRASIRARRGATLVEMMVVMTIMIAAASIFSQMVVATAQLREVQRENAIAAEAARVLIEEIRNEDFRDVFAELLNVHMGVALPAVADVLPGHPVQSANFPGLFG